MKIIALSDIHGDLPVIEDPCDVVCICGDIVPLGIQRHYTKSVAWLAGRFVTWCENLPCKKVIIIAGNHDFVFEQMYCDFLDKHYNGTIIEGADPDRDFAETVNDLLDFPGKIVYLQNSSYVYDGITFYGTPNIPELHNWAFYADSAELRNIFNRIPDKVDVLLSHSPGKFVNDTGVSLQFTHRPEYGSSELTEAVQSRDIKYWFVGHVHSGNHHLEKYGDIMVANVSVKDEQYRYVYEPLTVVIE